MDIYNKTADILLVEDNPGDVELTLEAFEKAQFAHRIHVAGDGEEALDFLFRRPPFQDKPRPDIVLLDLNLPKVGGREVLEILKTDPKLKAIPTVVLTSSSAESDVLSSYNLYANCYVVKPVMAEEYTNVVLQVEKFWTDVASRPPIG
tara:strand:+ start:713 stop:1156 length:444 start_codon:yes stop_codon:yes gene_type:complete